MYAVGRSVWEYYSANKNAYPSEYHTIVRRIFMHWPGARHRGMDYIIETANAMWCEVSELGDEERGDIKAVWRAYDRAMKRQQDRRGQERVTRRVSTNVRGYLNDRSGAQTPMDLVRSQDDETRLDLRSDVEANRRDSSSVGKKLAKVQYAWHAEMLLSASVERPDLMQDRVNALVTGLRQRVAETMRPELRTLFYCRFSLGLSIEDAAPALHLTLDQAKGRSKVALPQLRACLEAVFPPRVDWGHVELEALKRFNDEAWEVLADRSAIDWRLLAELQPDLGSLGAATGRGADRRTSSPVAASA